MNERTPQSPDGAAGVSPALDQALDQALARSLRPPTLSAAFRRGLEAAIARSGEGDHARLRAQLEREHRQAISDLRSGYIRVSRGTLITLVAAAFVSGIALVAAMPWLTEHFGPDVPRVLAGVGVAVAVGFGVFAWWPRSPFARLLD
jgi:hypothetical protein